MLKKIIIMISLFVLNCKNNDCGWHTHNWDDFVLCTQSRTNKKTSESETIKWITRQTHCENSSNGEFIDLVLDYRYLHDEKEIQEATKQVTHY